MISLIIGIALLLCLVGYFIWFRSGFYSFSGFSWLFVVVIIPAVLFIVGTFLTVLGASSLLGF